MIISKKAKLLALSSTEVEYLAQFEASKQIMWLHQELVYPPTTPTVAHEDNKSTITVISDANDKGRRKHMDIRCHYVRELVFNFFPSLIVHLLTTADMLTKPLDIKTHRNTLLGNLVCGGSVVLV